MICIFIFKKCFVYLCYNLLMLFIFNLFLNAFFSFIKCLEFSYLSNILYFHVRAYIKML